MQAEATFNPESISRLRRMLGLSQSQFAEAIGAAKDSVRNWEHGRSCPSGYHMDRLHRLCREKGIDPPVFFRPGRA